MATIKDVKKELDFDFIVKINNGTLWLDPTRKYIRWQNYGQSAVKNTLADLQWLLKHIFHVENLCNINYTLVSSPYS